MLAVTHGSVWRRIISQRKRRAVDCSAAARGRGELRDQGMFGRREEQRETRASNFGQAPFVDEKLKG